MAWEFISLWQKIKYKFKNNTAAIIAMIIGLVLLIFLILPTEKDLNKKITDKYTELAQTYDANTNQYTDFQKALKLRNEINDLQTTSKTTRLIITAVTSLILISLTGLLGTLLQYVYTDLPFTKKKFRGYDGIYDTEELGNSMPVLAAALLSAAIVVTSVYIITFLN